MDAFPSNRTIDNQIVKLRQKIETDPKKPRHILSIYGKGYKLVIEPHPATGSATPTDPS